MAKTKAAPQQAAASQSRQTIEVIRALRDFAAHISYCVPLSGDAEAARERIVRQADAWLKEHADAR